MFESRHHSELFDLRIETRLCLVGRDIADGFEQAAFVEPVNPFERRELYGFAGPPWSASVDHFGLEQPNHRFGQSVVVAVADTSHRGFDPGLRQALGIAD